MTNKGVVKGLRRSVFKISSVVILSSNGYFSFSSCDATVNFQNSKELHVSVITTYKSKMTQYQIIFVHNDKKP